MQAYQSNDFFETLERALEVRMNQHFASSGSKYLIVDLKVDDNFLQGSVQWPLKVARRNGGRFKPPTKGNIEEQIELYGGL